MKIMYSNLNVIAVTFSIGTASRSGFDSLQLNVHYASRTYNPDDYEY